MHQIFWVLLSIQGMALSDPSDFFVLAILSVGTVFCAALIFTAWAATTGARHGAKGASAAVSPAQLEGTILTLKATVSKLSTDIERMETTMDQRLTRLEKRQATS
jgi:hypothetical protein